MKMPNTIIEACAAKKDIRGYLNDVHLDVENKRLMASDGHKAVIIPVEQLHDDDTSGPVSVDALKAARKSRGRHVGASLEIVCNGACEVNGNSYARPVPVGKFPDIDRVMPDIDKPGTRKYCINPQYLIDIAKALTEGKLMHRGIVLHVPEDPTHSMLVTPVIGEGQGVIMPIRMD